MTKHECVEFDYSKLKGRIIEKFGSQGEFAKAYGKTENTISKKLNGKSNISRQEILKMCQSNLLDIPAERIGEYFFTLKVQDVEQ